MYVRPSNIMEYFMKPFHIGYNHDLYQHMVTLALTSASSSISDPSNGGSASSESISGIGDFDEGTGDAAEDNLLFFTSAMVTIICYFANQLQINWFWLTYGQNGNPVIRVQGIPSKQCHFWWSTRIHYKDKSLKFIFLEKRVKKEDIVHCGMPSVL